MSLKEQIKTLEWDELIEVRSLVKSLLDSAAEAKLAGYSFSEEQIEDLGRLFYKWVNEGQGTEYFPGAKWFPDWLDYILEGCVGDIDRLDDLFSPKGVDVDC